MIDLATCLSLSDYIAQANSEQLTASSDWDNIYSADRSRLYTTQNHGWSGGWNSGVNSVGEYLQVDLRTVRRLERVATQGRAGGVHWVTSYRIAHSVDGTHYAFLYNYDGSETVFAGNSADYDTVVEHEFHRTIVARYVRLYPQTWVDHMSLRWEVYGCDIGRYYFSFEFKSKVVYCTKKSN